MAHSQQHWTRRRFMQTSAAALQVASVRCVSGAGLLNSALIMDHTGADYVRIEPGAFLMGEQNKIPLEMCEPLAYMTRAELQALFPHGDPARLVLSDVLV